MQSRKFGTVVTAALWLAATSAGLVILARPSAGAEPVAQGPVLDPNTGSYFELRIDNKTDVPGGHTDARWEHAVARAARHSYKGRRGRLAIVKDLEMLSFVRQNFQINQEAWIGLRFFCKYRKLLWVTGELQPLNVRGLWHRQWFRSASERCRTSNNMDYMPIYLTNESQGEGFWQATGPAKFFVSYFVEYPAPEKPTAEADVNGTRAE